MKKCIFIVPYFGKLPNYFPLFLRSCELNEEIDWVILTDDNTNYVYPGNVRRVYFTFKDLKNMIQSNFDFKIHLDTFQKLCDYKPCYGFIFEKYINNYKFWGYCDIDLIWGDISKFLPHDFESYDKLFELGHCTIFKNTFENNRLFMKKLNGKYIYKWCYSQDQVTTFDEVYGDNPDINDIFLKYGKKVFRSNYSFDVQPGVISFQDANYDYRSHEYHYEKNYHNKLCIWNKGKILRLYKKNNVLINDEYMYIHLQDRKMGWSKKCLDFDEWKIVPEYIKPVHIRENDLLKLIFIPKYNVDVNSLLYFLNRILARVKHIFLRVISSKKM